MYTIKEVSEMLGMTEHTIRYYTDKGLVPSLKRDKNNNRLFDEESINWLIGAKFLRACGMSIDTIKNFFDLHLQGNSTVKERYEIVLTQKEKTYALLEEVKKRAETLEIKAQHYLDIMNNLTLNDSNNW